MRNILFLLFFSPLSVFSQYTGEIQLSKKMDESRLGLWQQGNYQIWVSMDELEKRYRQTGNGYLEAMKSNTFSDSTKSFYQVTADRYLLAANLLKNAEYGFDLRKLVVYYGPNDETQNTGNAFVVENDVRYYLESGQAAVYKNEERIYTLKNLHENSPHGITGTDITIYYDSVEDPIFKYYHDYGW